MATNSIGDFWRRRKVFIIIGLILLCAVAAFVHLRRRGLTPPRVTQKQHAQQELVKNSVSRGRKGKMDPPSLIKHLPPVLSRQRFKGKGKRKFDNRGKVDDVQIKKPEDDDNYNMDDGKGDMFGGKRKDLDGQGRGENIGGEAPHGDDPVMVLPGQEEAPPDIPDGGMLPDREGRPDHQLGNPPEQPGNQPGNPPEQPGNQPGNPPEQPWNVGKEPGNLPERPRNALEQPGEHPAAQHGNRHAKPQKRPIQRQPVQPGNLPEQPWNPRMQPENQPVQNGNLPGQAWNPPVQPGNPQPQNQPVQPGNPSMPSMRPGKQRVQPVDPPMQPVQPVQPDHSPGPHNRNIPGPATDLYVHSTMPLGQPLSSTKTQHQEAVVQAFKHAWKAYRNYAWGADDVNPISHSSSSTSFGMGMTLVDSLDTLWLMGLKEEFQEARDWVEHNLNFDHNLKTVSLFETNIRVLGGLLSAYHLSGDRMFLDKAVKLGSHLLPAFDTPSGIPSNTVSMSRGGHPGRSISTAEAGTLQLEFRDLSRASGNPTFQEKCDMTLDKMLSQTQGIVLQGLNCNNGRYSGSVYSAGAGTDSYYEYLIKQWIQSGMTENKFREAYETSVHEVLQYLVGYSQPSHMAYLGKRFSLSTHQPPSPVMDHLSCFYPGMLALGAMYQVLPSTTEMAANLTHTCYHMYESTSPTGIAPEIFQFNLSPQSTSDTVKSSDVQNIQRPETVESLFYMYRLTKDQRYQDWGWRIFQAFEKYTKIDGAGYACLKNVHSPGSFRDRTESFFLTETLKYLYLLFGDDDSVLSLREWVFNTEAHPLPIWKM